MVKSEAINELAAALAKAQGQMEGAKKDADNPFFKSKYADLASVVEAIRGPFAEHGLSYVQCPDACEGEEVAVDTVLMHASGQWISSRTVVPVTKKDAQGYGSALTYARRYGLQAIAGVAAEDDDGNAAASAKPSAKPRAKESMPTPGVVSPAQAETEANRNFPSIADLEGALPEIDVETQRNLLLGQIKGCADRLKLKAPDRANLWTRYVGGDPTKADPAALQDLLDHLRSVLPEEKT